MTYTLFNAVLDVADRLGVLFRGQATGGSTTTILDTVTATDYTSKPTNYFRGGAAFIFYSTDGLAPQGEYSRITIFNANSPTVITTTVSPAFTAAVASGDRYALAHSRYPLHKLIGAVNTALSDLGIIPINNTSITASPEITEYDLPVAAGLDVREVYYQSLVETDNNRWVKINGWSIQKAGTGTGDVLILPYYLPDAATIKVVYMDRHASLVNSSDAIDETVHPDRVIYPACLKLLEERLNFYGRDDETLTDRITYYRTKIQESERRYPIMAPHRRSKVFVVRRV